MARGDRLCRNDQVLHQLPERLEIGAARRGFAPGEPDGPARLLLPADFANAPMLRERQGLEIDYVAGYGAGPADVPASLRQAVLLLVGYWFENRDSVIIAGAGSIVPSGLDQLVAPYRAVRL